MFENLTDKLQRAFKNLRGQGKLTEEHLDVALAQIREAIKPLHLGQYSRGVFASAFAPCNFVVRFVALSFQALDGGDGFAAFLIQRAESGDIERRAAVARHLLEQFQMIAKITQVMHVSRKHTAKHGRDKAAEKG